MLQLYNEVSQECRMFQEIMDDRETSSASDIKIPNSVQFYSNFGWTEGLPWLYYTGTAKQVLVDEGPLDLTVSFYDSTDDTSRTNKLKYWLARYNLEGKFLGWKQLSTQLSPCPLTESDVMYAEKFGVVTEVTCEFELFKLTSDITNQLPTDANVFFELYVEGDSKGELIDVPVLIRNFRNGQNKQPNLESNQAYFDMNTSRLTHRFFIYDTISGIENTGGYTEKKIANVVRLATTVKLTVELDPT